jgi:hypothetical protein
VDTLVKYLVDSLQRYENDYGNALCPVQNEPDQSFMGDHTLLKPVTVNEFRMFGTTIMSALKTSSGPSTVCSQLNTPQAPAAAAGDLPNPPSNLEKQPTSQQTPTGTPGAIYCSDRTERTAVTVAISLANTILLAGVCIPDLPRSRGGWHIALRQWYDINPKTGYALKDWPDAWFKGSMKAKTAAKRSQRALISHEYERLVIDFLTLVFFY